LFNGIRKKRPRRGKKNETAQKKKAGGKRREVLKIKIIKKVK